MADTSTGAVQLHQSPLSPMRIFLQEFNTLLCNVLEPQFPYLYNDNDDIEGHYMD